MTPNSNKAYKLFLVEVDDDDRERVIACRGINFSIDHVYDYSDVEVDHLLDSAKIFKDRQTKVTMRADIVPLEDGPNGPIYFRVENFLEEEEEDFYQPQQWEVYQGA